MFAKETYMQRRALLKKNLGSGVLLFLGNDESKEYRITLRSIDLGAMEVVSTYEELQHFNKVGSPFSIPKAALVLAGFHPDFSMERFASLEAQLKAFGTGIEVMKKGI